MTKPKQSFLRGMTILLALGLALSMALVATAATITVTTTVDEDDGDANPANGAGTSLREAINHPTAGDDIVFAAGVTGTLTLTLGELTINKNLTITGPGADVLTVSGNNTSRVFFISYGNFDVIISGLTVADGNSGEGGGIRWVSEGTLTINNCTFFSNESNAGGAGRLDGFGTVNINNSTFFENTGANGALRLEEVTLNVTNSTFFNNTADRLGGAITATEESVANISNCTISGNTSNGSVADSGGGGGIALFVGPNAVNIKNTIVVGNNAPNRPATADILVGSGPRLGPMVSADFNLFGVVSSNPGTFIPAANDQIAVTAAQVNLGALAIEAPGTTATLPLQAGSIAIDGITNVAQCTDVQGNAIATDQRGVTRPQGTFCDIGAYEHVAAANASLDIKPQSCPNPLNVTSKGVLPVAILGTVDLDVNDIDPSSVQLEGVPTLRSSIDDVSTPVADPQDECDCTTDGADGFDDLELKFDIQDLVAAIDAVNDGDKIVLTLTGNLLDGTDIKGQDCVIIKLRELKSQ